MSALVSKRGELHGQIDYHQKKIKQIKIDMESMDRAIKVFDPDYDLRQIKSRKTNGKNNFFEPREGNILLMDIFRVAKAPMSTGDLLDEVIRRKGLTVKLSTLRRLEQACS